MEHKNSIAGIRRLPLVFAIVVALTTAAIADVHATAQEAQQRVGSSTSEATLSLPTPEHRKYVTRNTDGTYGLTLSVTGQTSSWRSGLMKDRVPADIVLVMNNSDSMRGKPVGPSETRWTSMRDTATSFMKGVLSDKRQDKSEDQTRISTIFYGKGDKFGVGLTLSAKDASESFFYGGREKTPARPNSTAESALQEANNYLGKARPGVAKYIVLITDDATPSSDAVLTVANQRPEGTKLFVVNAGDSGSTEAAQLKQLAQGAGALFYEGKGSGGLNAAFRDILARAGTRNLSYANAHIQDKLSAYVKPAGDDGNPKITAEAVNANGVSVTETDQAAKKMKPKYDDGTKMLTLGFEDGTKLTDGVTYRVVMVVEPSDEAHREYVNANGRYPHTGERDAGSGSGDASSGMKGFYSNEGEATLTYSMVKWTDARDTVVDSQQTATYGKPVIQVKPTTVTLVTKVDNTYAGRHGAKPSDWNLSAMNGQSARNPMTPTRQVIPAGSNEPDVTQMATQTTLVVPGSYSLGYERGRHDYPYYEGYDASWICVDARAGGAGLVGSSGSSDPDPGQHEQPLPDPSSDPSIPFGPGDFHFPSHSDTIPFDGDLSPGPFSPPRPNPLAPDPGPGNNLVLNTVDNPQITVKPGQNAVCTVTFKAKPGKLTWDKVNERGNLLGGSHWSLTSTDVDGFVTKTITDNGNEDADKTDGKFVTTGLKWGEYKLMEDKAPDGHKKLGNPLKATVLPVDGVLQEGDFFTVGLGNVTNHKADAADVKPGKPGKPSKPGKPGLAATGAWVTGGVTVMMLTLAAAGAVLLVRRRFMH